MNFIIEEVRKILNSVFIVDDEEMVTTSIKAMLVLETDYQVHCFNSPLEALDQLLKLHPDVVISDFLMPSMDGITFLKQVKAKLPESTLILLTGYADKESAIQAINQIGIYRYIEKPWDNEEIKLSIKNGLERTHLISDLQRTVEALTQAKAQLQSYNQSLEQQVEAKTRDLRITYQKLQSIVQNTADGILTLDANLCVTSLNPAITRWAEHGLNRKLEGDTDFSATILGKPIQDFLKIELHSQLLQEGRFFGLQVEVSIAPVLAPHSDVFEGYVLVLRDIAKRKEVERLRDDFMSTLTHDLRTPLLAAIQTLNFFLEGGLGPLTSRQAEIIRMLVQSNRDLLGLVNVLLEVYKYESGKQQLVFDAVNPAELLNTICRELEALAMHKKQQLKFDLKEPLPSLYGDKQELRRVFVNLIGNAIHHTPADGVIEISGEHDGNGRVKFSIRDNGRGIPEKDIPTLFQRFSHGTSIRRSSGTGLGLYLSRQIVDAHQGRIWVESKEGQGSVFSVLLPTVEKFS